MFSRLQTEMYRITLIGAAEDTLPGKAMTEEGYKSRL